MSRAALGLASARHRSRDHSRSHGNGRAGHVAVFVHTIGLTVVRLTSFVVLPVAAALLTDGPAAQPERLSERNPFWFFEPAVELDVEERQSIALGEPIVKILDAEGEQLAVFAGGSLDTTPEAFIAKVRNIVALRKGRYVPVAARFASPPQLSDLSSLTLGESDLEDLEACRPRNCGLKLGAEEVVRLQRLSPCLTRSARRQRSASSDGSFWTA